MKRFTVSFYVIIIVMSMFSCGSKQESATADVDSASTEMDAADKSANQLAMNDAADVDLYSDGRTKLVKSVKYRFEVESVKKSTEAIEAAIRKYPAYIASSSLHLENPLLENKLSIRVRSEYFHALLKEIDQQSLYTNFRDVTSDDVSKQFVDLESRLKTKREVEERYAEILRKKAGTLEELFDAEKKIEELHEDIEATVSRINFLRDQVSYSTIELEFYQTLTAPLKAKEELTLGDELLKGLATGWHATGRVLIALTYLWPLYLLTAAVLYIIRFRKLRMSRMSSR
ncbi:MAG TPA: DUF4349 domain-containing protein [Chryseolinea sp.]